MIVGTSIAGGDRDCHTFRHEKQENKNDFQPDLALKVVYLSDATSGIRK
jgi:hypothetical protein